MDEAHHDLSITGDKAGTQALKYHNPSLQQEGPQRQVKCSHYVTGVYTTNAAGEALPPMNIFDLGATKEENFRVKMEWVEGLPSIKGWLGHHTCIVTQSFYTVHAKGSMDNSVLNDNCECVVISFPIQQRLQSLITKQDKNSLWTHYFRLNTRPGFIVKDEDKITKRYEFCERVFLVQMGLTNVTSAQHKMMPFTGHSRVPCMLAGNLC